MNILCSNSYCNRFRQPQHWLQERIFIKLVVLRKDSVRQISEVYPSKRFGGQPHIVIDRDCPTPRTAATSAIPTPLHQTTALSTNAVSHGTPGTTTALFRTIHIFTAICGT